MAPVRPLRLSLAALALAGASACIALAQTADPLADLQNIGARQDAISQDLGDERNRIARLLTALLMFRREPPPALIASPDQALNAVRSAILAREMAPLLAKRAQELAAQEQALGLLRRDAAAADADYFTQRSQMAENDALDALLASQPPVAVPAPPQPDASPNAPFVMPLDGRLTRGFTAGDPGLLFTGKPGATVVSPSAGLVDYVGAGGAYSVVVILRLADGRHIVLAGLGSAGVKAGQTLKAGATIGKLAQTGANLYMELRQGDQPVDPTGLLRQQSVAAF